MDLSKQQIEDILIKYYGQGLARAISKVIEEGEIDHHPVFGIYEERFDLSLRVKALENENTKLKKRIHSLENIIKAKMESKKGWLKGWFK